MRQLRCERKIAKSTNPLFSPYDRNYPVFLGKSGWLCVKRATCCDWLDLEFPKSEHHSL